MDKNWKKWFLWQCEEARNFFDVHNAARQNPPVAVCAVFGGLSLLAFVLIIS